MRKRQLKALDRKSLEVRAADALLDAIALGKIASGTRLTEMQLAEDLSASRGTVRAALMKVCSAGLIVQRPYSSWEVIQLSPSDIWELYTLRAALEGLAVRILIEQSRDKEQRAVAAAFGRLQNACEEGSSPAIAQADLEFHKTIITGSQHELLGNHFGRVEYRIRMLIASSNAMLASPAQVLFQHEPIATAIAKGDHDTASTVLQKHILDEGQALVSAVGRSTAA
jgi:DNA-binding GntR family transcriptional regulator